MVIPPCPPSYATSVRCDGAGAAAGQRRNPARLAEVCGLYKPQVVYHAAAYKHVPLVESNPAEGVLNNVFGTLNMALAARQCGASHFVLISTDKAVRPTNIMGATKRMAEMVAHNLAQLKPHAILKANSFTGR